MDLRKYLFEKRIKISEFSKMIDYSRNHLNQVVVGNISAGMKMAKAIELATNGEVKIKDLIKKKTKIQKDIVDGMV